MRTISIVVGAAVVATLMSGPPVAAEDAKDPVVFCGAMGDLAEAVMTIRQSGVAMSKAMSIAAGDEALSSVATKMLMAAYDTPQYSAETNRKDAATRFRNDFEVECFKSLME